MDEELDKLLNRKSGFRYTAINPRSQVRLLRISGGLRLNDVQYNLETASLAGLHIKQYRALSYTRGHLKGPEDVREIKLDGELFFVRRNLHDFLHTIAAKNEVGLFFVDAICINQLDPGERRCQVKEMTRIYRNATEVIAWLGFPESHEQLDNVRCLSQEKGQGECATWTAQHWEAFRYLSYHHYWSRVWVVQEVLLAAKMTVWSGFFTFPLSLFAASSPPAPLFLSRTTFASDHDKLPRSVVTPSSRSCSPAGKVVSHRTRQVLRPGTDTLAQGTEVGTLEEITVALRSNSHAVAETYRSTVMDPLYQVVAGFGRLHCSDVRDKLYGFLGIMDEHARAQVSPDYTQDVRFAFYQALKIGLHEICTEEAGLAHLQHPLHVERLCMSYFCDARDVFGIDNTESLSILRQVVGGKPRYQGIFTTDSAETLSVRQFIWCNAEVGMFPDSTQVIRSREPVKPVYSVGWLWRFHHRQFQLMEKMRVNFTTPGRKSANKDPV